MKMLQKTNEIVATDICEPVKFKISVKQSPCDSHFMKELWNNTARFG